MKKFLQLITCIAISISINAFASIIKEIEITGLTKTDQSIIFAKTGLKTGMEINPSIIDQAIKVLYATDLFKDISISEKNGTLFIDLKENPIVRNIIIKGNKKIDTKTIKKEIRINKMSTLSEPKLMQDIKKINDIYIKNGNLNSKVTYETKEVGKDTVDLLIKIYEGKKAKIQNIIFIGNNDFDSFTLKSVLKIHENKWYHFSLSGFDIYNEELIAYNEELLRMFYMSNGYFDFVSTNVVAEISPECFGVNIVFDIHEGERYRVGEISIDHESYKDLFELNDFINIKKGDVFNKRKIDSIISKMNSRLIKEKNFSITIDTNQKRNTESHTIDIEFITKPIQKIKINKINISGNTDTKDVVIRRQMLITEGEESNLIEINKSKRKIEKTGLFKIVDVYTQKTMIANEIDVNIKVEEAQTTSINFGAGYDSSQGIVGVVSVNETNFRGMGQHIDISINRNNRQNDFSFGFFEPHITKTISTGFDFFRMKHGLNEYEPFKQKKYGGSVYVGKEINDNLTTVIRLSHMVDDIYDVKFNASKYIQEQEGKSDVTTIDQTMTYNNFSNPTNPTDGFGISFTKSIALPISDTKYIKSEGKITSYTTINKDFALRTIAKGGGIMGYDKQNIKINDRFFLGINDIRGFDVNGIGPRDLNTGEALGGNVYFLAKAQLEKGIKYMPQFDLKASIFLDTATLFSIDKEPNSNIIDSKTIRVSSGIGFSWVSPIGPMRIDYGIPIVKTNFDKTKNVRFIIGWNF